MVILSCSHLNRVQQVSYGLSEVVVDSGLFYRTLPSTTYITEAMVVLLDHFQWFKVGVISSADEQYMKVSQCHAIRMVLVDDITSPRSTACIVLPLPCFGI